MPTPRRPSALQNDSSLLIASRSQSRTSLDKVPKSKSLDFGSPIGKTLNTQELAYAKALERLKAENAAAEPEDPESNQDAELRKSITVSSSKSFSMSKANNLSFESGSDGDKEHRDTLPTLLRQSSTAAADLKARGGLSRFKQSLQATQEMMQGNDEDMDDDIANIRFRLDRKLGRERLDGLLFGDLLSDDRDPLRGMFPTLPSNPYAAVDDPLTCTQSRNDAVKWEPTTVFTPKGAEHSVEQRLGSEHETLSMFVYTEKGHKKEFNSLGAAESYSRWQKLKCQRVGTANLFSNCCQNLGNPEPSDFVCMQQPLNNRDGLVVPYTMVSTVSEDGSTTTDDSDDWLLSVSSGASSRREAGYSEWAMTPRGDHGCTVQKAFC